MSIINDNLNILNIINDNPLDDYYKIEKTNGMVNKKNIYKNENNDIYLNSDNNINNSFKIKNLKNIEYGIDENGNPIRISGYPQDIKKDKNQRLIAYITKEGDKNILIDLNGNKIEKKNKEGDYEYPFLLNILIKDFDVQHPEIRTNDEMVYKYINLKKNIIK